MQLSGQPLSQGSLLPAPGNEVVLSLFTGCVKSVKNVDVKCVIYIIIKKIIFYNEDCFCTWSRFESEGFLVFGSC